MMLRDITPRILFDKSLKNLSKEEILICNRFIDNYTKIKSIME